MAVRDNSDDQKAFEKYLLRANVKRRQKRIIVIVSFRGATQQLFRVLFNRHRMSSFTFMQIIGNRQSFGST